MVRGAATGDFVLARNGVRHAYQAGYPSSAILLGVLASLQRKCALACRGAGGARALSAGREEDARWSDRVGASSQAAVLADA